MELRPLFVLKGRFSQPEVLIHATILEFHSRGGVNVFLFVWFLAKVASVGRIYVGAIAGKQEELQFSGYTTSL